MILIGQSPDESEWWQEGLAQRLSAALYNINGSRNYGRHDELLACRLLLDGINNLYEAHSYQKSAATGCEPDASLSDAAKLTQMLNAVPAGRKFSTDGELLRLAALEPPLMDQKELQKLENPYVERAIIPPMVLHAATSKHRHFREEFSRFRTNGAAYKRMVRALASTTLVFRNNLQHGEKNGFSRRDHDVAEVMRAVLEAIVDIVLDFPSRSLATYGVLTDDDRFAEVTGYLPSRESTVLSGKITVRNGQKFLTIDPIGCDLVDVSIVNIDVHSDTYLRLDSFEGSDYKRELALVQLRGRRRFCNVYVAREEL